MNISVYQVNMQRDTNNVCFRNLEFTQKHQKSRDIDSSIYDKTYTCSLPAKSLEDVYYTFNCKYPQDYRCRSLSVSDIVEITNCPEVEEGFYFCDSVGFQKVDFDPSKTKISSLINDTKALEQAFADPETGLIRLQARLGICLEVTPEEMKVLHGIDDDAHSLLTRLVQSNRCVMSGDTYFPGPWNEDVLSVELNYDLPTAPLSVPEKKPSLDDQIRATQDRNLSATEKNDKNRDVDRDR